MLINCKHSFRCNKLTLTTMAEPETLDSYMPARRRNPDNLDNADSRDTNPAGGSPVQNPFGGSGSNDGYERFMTLHRGARGTLKSDRKGEMRYISGPYKGMTEGQGDVIGNNTFSRMSDQERDRYRPVNAADRAAAAAAEEQSFQKALEREKIAMRERLKIEKEQRDAQTAEDARKIKEQEAKEAADKAAKDKVGTPIVTTPAPATGTGAAGTTTTPSTTGSSTPATGSTPGTTPAPTTASASSSPAAAGAASATTPTVPVAPVTNPAETNKTPQPSATSSPMEEGKVSQAPVMNPIGLAANSMSQPSFGNRLRTGASQTGNTEKLRQQNLAKRMA